jgi:hypothetical protein
MAKTEGTGHDCRTHLTAGETFCASDDCGRKVIFASSLGIVFEWYDSYLYGSLAASVGAQFFSGVNETARYVFALLAFGAGFAVRPPTRNGRHTMDLATTYAEGKSPSWA